ncbi:hypothetical protein HN51_035707, partial [Arachis hypogaea]
ASDLRNNINIVNAAAEEIKNSVKLRRIMQTILSLGNALNQGTAKDLPLKDKKAILTAWELNIILLGGKNRYGG